MKVGEDPLGVTKRMASIIPFRGSPGRHDRDQGHLLHGRFSPAIADFLLVSGQAIGR